MLYDISPVIDPALKVWPGDTPPSREVLLDMHRGDNLTLCTLHSTVHAGAHVDAPSHYDADGETIDLRPLDLYIGSCEVIEVRVPPSTRVPPSALPGPVRAERVLLKTGTFPEPTRFNEDFAAYSVELVDDLHRQRVRLIGLDTPSVDLFPSKDLPVHRRCFAHDMAILEGVVLDGVPPGIYELIALPLPLAGFDASPVRAVLRTRPAGPS